MKGNHDELALHYSSLPPEQRPKKFKWLKKASDEELQFLSGLPHIITISKLNVIVVHAGIIPGIPVESQDPTIVTTMRNLSNHQQVCVIVTNLTPSRANSLLVKDQKKVVWLGPRCGKVQSIFSLGTNTLFYFLNLRHDAHRKLQIRDFSTGLDTGCCKGGHLTACILPGKHLVSVPAKMVSLET